LIKVGVELLTAPTYGRITNKEIVCSTKSRLTELSKKWNSRHEKFFWTNFNKIWRFLLKQNVFT